MSSLKRLRRKRALQKQANIRYMALKKDSKALLGSKQLMDRLTQDHEDVLQNIEFVLVTGYREDGSIDDLVAASVLKAAIQGDALRDERAILLSKRLEEMRQFRSDISDDVWRDSLRVVLQSVHRHSSLHYGSREYLDFVCDFIP